MSRKKKLYDLRLNISNDVVSIKYLLENAIYKADSERETMVLVSIAIELIEKIRINAEKIGKILKH